MPKLPTARDHDCARQARAALFPPRMHRDVQDSTLFPALLVLTQLRQRLQEQHELRASSLFPPRVVVVQSPRNQQYYGQSWQWNGQPDIREDASFSVIPGRLSVRCTECGTLGAFRRAFLEHQSVGNNNNDSNNSATGHNKTDDEVVVVVCSDRVLGSDYQAPLSSAKSMAEDVRASRSSKMHVVEEVLAHQLAKVSWTEPATHDTQHGNANDTVLTQQAGLEVAAARAAECYYSSRTVAGRNTIQRGSQLPLGYSLLPEPFRRWAHNRCLSRVAVREVVSVQQGEKDTVKHRDIRVAVRKAVYEDS